MKQVVLKNANENQILPYMANNFTKEWYAFFSKGKFFHLFSVGDFVGFGLPDEPTDCIFKCIKHALCEGHKVYQFPNQQKMLSWASNQIDILDLSESIAKRAKDDIASEIMKLAEGKQITAKNDKGNFVYRIEDINKQSEGQQPEKLLTFPQAVREMQNGKKVFSDSLSVRGSVFEIRDNIIEYNNKAIERMNPKIILLEDWYVVEENYLDEYLKSEENYKKVAKTALYSLDHSNLMDAAFPAMGLSFEQAMTEIQKGKIVFRKKHSNSLNCKGIAMQGNKFALINMNDVIVDDNYLLDCDDQWAEDWYVFNEEDFLEEKEEALSFEQAISSAKRGKKIARQGWKDGLYWYAHEDSFYKHIDELDSEYFFSDDWYIVKDFPACKTCNNEVNKIYCKDCYARLQAQMPESMDDHYIAAAKQETCEKCYKSEKPLCGATCDDWSSKQTYHLR